MILRFQTIATTIPIDFKHFGFGTTPTDRRVRPASRNETDGRSRGISRTLLHTRR